MAAFGENTRQINRQGIILYHAELAGKCLAQFCKRRQAAMIALNSRHVCASPQQGACEAAGARADLINLLTRQIARNGCNPIKQLPIKQKILSKRLAGGKAMARDDLAQGRKFDAHAA